MVVAGDMAANITSSGFNVRAMDNIGLQFHYTGTAATGTWSFEASNTSTTGADGTWFVVTLDDPPPAPSASAGADFGVDLNQWPYEWVRLKYTRTSGSGTLDVIALGKEI
jgi:hypothetical protein